MAARLVVACLRQSTRQRQHQCQRMLCHRAFVGALSARESNAAHPQRFMVVLIGAGADRLDEAQVFGTIEQLIAPETGHREYLSLADSRRELFERPQLEE